MDLRKSLAHHKGGNKIVQKKKHFAYLGYYDLMSEIYEKLLKMHERTDAEQEMQMWKQDVISNLKSNYKEIVQQIRDNEIDPLELWIVGSILTDKFHENSDVDLAIVVEEGSLEEVHQKLIGKVFFEDVGVLDIVPMYSSPKFGIKIY